jgi:type I restriction enzyme S subunit
MASRKCKIGELGRVVTGKTPSTGKSEYWGGDYPFITIPDLSDLPFVEHSSRTLSELGAAAIKNQLLPKNSVLMSCIATVGKCGITTKPSFTNQQINAVIPNSKIDPLFLLYLFRNLGAEMAKFGSGGTVYSNISKSLFESIEVEIPESLITQQAIAKVLAALDAKIAVNNALSKTLEDIAQAIFKSWFIDFDPVKAKIAGTKPAGMDAETALHFPDSKWESELGEIPKGWEYKKVEEVLSRITVKGLPKSTVVMNLGRTLVLEQGNSVIAGFIDASADIEATSESPAFVFGDHTCRMRLSTMPFSIFPNTIVLKSEIRNTYWAFGATNGLQKFETYRRHWMELAYKVLIVPSEEVADAFGKQVKSFYELIDLLMVQSRELSALRDELLPRLISGELQIPEEMLVS